MEITKRIIKRKEAVLFYFPSTRQVKEYIRLLKLEGKIFCLNKDFRLKGRGGAGFPTATKWMLTAASVSDKKYIICNADEGEPGTFKDRVLLLEYPELVFEGMVIAGFAIGAEQGIVYLRGEYEYML